MSRYHRLALPAPLRVLRLPLPLPLPLALALALLASGCIHESLGIGQTAEIAAPGTVEVGVAGGTAYQGDTPPGGGSSKTTLTAPVAEGNLSYALTDSLALNLHGSAAGAQPGVKIAIHRGSIDLSLLPELSIGYQSSHSSQDLGGGMGTQQTDGSTWLVLVGAKLLLTSGSLYGAVGYDYEDVSSSTHVVSPAGTTDLGNVQTAHDFTFGAGWSITLSDGLIVRPELDLLYAPWIGVNNSGPMSSSATGGSSWVLFPNVTVALATLTMRPRER